MTPEIALQHFLHNLKNTNKSPQTIRVYRSDLKAFISHCPDDLDALDVSHLRNFFTQHDHLKPATQSRKQSSVGSFL